MAEDEVDAGVRVGRFLKTRGIFPDFRGGWGVGEVAGVPSAVSGGTSVGEGATTLRSGTSDVHHVRIYGNPVCPKKQQLHST